MRIITAFIFFLSSVALSSEQIEIKVHGKKVSCTGLNRMSASFNDVVSTTPEKVKGGYMPLFGYVVTIDSQYLNSLPSQAALFSVYHGCAHVGIPIGSSQSTEDNEKKADCFAVAKMAENGYLESWPAFNKAMLSLLEGGVVHGFNKQRMAALSSCPKAGKK